MVEKQEKYPFTPLHLALGLDKLVCDVMAELDNPDEIWRNIREADPMVIGSYFQLLLDIARELEIFQNKNFQILEIPVDWNRTVGLLLTGKFFQ